MNVNWVALEANRDFIPTPSQIEYSQRKLLELAEVNAPVQAGNGFRVWAVFEGTEIVGNLCVVQVWGNEDNSIVTAEIGVNYWVKNPAAAYRATERWAKDYLWLYTHIMCRVLSKNEPIKRMLKRFGFARLMEMDGIEVWSVAYNDIRWLRGDE